MTGTFIYILCVVAVSYYANTLGRSFVGWALVSFIFTPFLASIVLLIIGNSTNPAKS